MATVPSNNLQNLPADAGFCAASRSSALIMALEGGTGSGADGAGGRGAGGSGSPSTTFSTCLPTRAFVHPSSSRCLQTSALGLRWSHPPTGRQWATRALAPSTAHVPVVPSCLPMPLAEGLLQRLGALADHTAGFAHEDHPEATQQPLMPKMKPILASGTPVALHSRRPRGDIPEQHLQKAAEVGAAAAEVCPKPAIVQPLVKLLQGRCSWCWGG